MEDLLCLGKNYSPVLKNKIAKNLKRGISMFKFDYNVRSDYWE